MTDNEIIKALECCINAENCCECVYTKMCDGTTICQFALDLINRQKSQILKERNKNSKLRNERNRLKAEIEELQAEIDKQYEQAKADILGNMSDGGTSCHWCIEQHKAEVVKEVAKRIKADAKWICDDSYIENSLIEYVDNLVKEMEGEG